MIRAWEFLRHAIESRLTVVSVAAITALCAVFAPYRAARAAADSLDGARPPTWCDACRSRYAHHGSSWCDRCVERRRAMVERRRGLSQPLRREGERRLYPLSGGRDGTS